MHKLPLEIVRRIHPKPYGQFHTYQLCFELKNFFGISNIERSKNVWGRKMKKENRSRFPMRWLRKVVSGNRRGRCNYLFSGTTPFIYIMEKYLIIGLLTFLITPTSLIFAQVNQNNVYPFLKSDEKVEKNITDSILITSGFREEVINKKKIKYPVSKRIYFTDKNGNVFKEFNFFPEGSQKQSGALYRTDSKKYIAVRRLYTLDQKRISDYVILDLKGNALLEKQKGTATLFISDTLNRFAFAGPMDGKLLIFDNLGNLLKEEKYSSFTEISEDDEEADPLLMDGGIVSDNGKLFCFSRYRGEEKNIFYEITLLDFDGHTLFQKNINNWYGKILKVFEDKKIIVVLEHTLKIGAFRYAGYDFDGNELWVAKKTNYLFKGISEDGKYLMSTQGPKLDLFTGEIITN